MNNRAGKTVSPWRGSGFNFGKLERFLVLPAGQFVMLQSNAPSGDPRGLEGAATDCVRTKMEGWLEKLSSGHAGGGMRASIGNVFN